MKACNCAYGPRTLLEGVGRRRFATARPSRKVFRIAELGRDVVPRPREESGTSPYRRLLNFIGWIVPTATLALIPKCPACVAGYAVIGTSVGFSLSAFAQLRLALIVLCVVSLFLVGTKSVLYVVTRIASKRHS